MNPPLPAPPPKSPIFQLNPNPSFSSLTPPSLLKVLKFLVKISQLESFVMIEKNIFAYNFFLSLNIPDFNLFFMWKLQSPLLLPWINSPPLSLQPPSKVEFLSSPTFLKIGWRFNPQQQWVHTMEINMMTSSLKAFMDDITVLTKTVHTAKEMLEILGDLIKWFRMKFKAKKSRTCTIANGKQKVVWFTIAGENIPKLRKSL